MMVDEYRVSGQSLIIHKMKINKLDSWIVGMIIHWLVDDRWLESLVCFVFSLPAAVDLWPVFSLYESMTHP